MAGFTTEQRHELISLGLTEAQANALGRTLPSIESWLRPLPTSTDVRAELRQMAGELGKAETRLKQWRNASYSIAPHKREALGHFNINADDHVRSRKSALGVDLDGDHDPAELIAIVAKLARFALDDAPANQRRNPRAAPWAIMRIVAALREPKDDKSRLAADRLAPARGGDFERLAQVVWHAVLGPDAPAPANSIRAYLDESP